jgi:uncharacterized protein (UPF0147 family)
MHAHTFARAADAQLSLRRALAHLSIARDLIQSVADDALGRAVRENADDALGQLANAIQSTEGALRAAVVASGMAEVVDPVAASQAETLARFERFIARAS